MSMVQRERCFIELVCGEAWSKGFRGSVLRCARVWLGVQLCVTRSYSTGRGYVLQQHRGTTFVEADDRNFVGGVF